MPVIKVHLDDAAYRRLVKRRRAEGMPSVSALLLNSVGELDNDKVAAEIVRRAKIKALNRDKGTRFRLRELFPSEQWEKFPTSARLKAGRLFYAQMSAAVDGIMPDAKSSAGHQYYIKNI